MVDERIARRRQQVRRQRQRHRLRRTLMVVAALAVAVALLVVERSPLVAISDVHVTGTEIVPDAAVVAASGIRPGTSLLRVDLAGAADQVAELPDVEHADVVRVDPITIEIRVFERTPRFVVHRQGRRVVVDDDGVAMTVEPGDGLQTITLTTQPLPQPGDAADPATELGNVVQLAGQLPGPLLLQVAGFEGRGPDDAVVELDTGTRVEMGRAEQVEAKARALGVVLEDLDGQQVSVIDVRSPSNPVVTP